MSRIPNTGHITCRSRQEGNYGKISMDLSRGNILSARWGYVPACWDQQRERSRDNTKELSGSKWTLPRDWRASTLGTRANTWGSGESTFRRINGTSKPQDQARAMRRRDHEKHLRGPFTIVGDQIQHVGIMWSIWGSDGAFEDHVSTWGSYVAFRIYVQCLGIMCST
jgi:hypothetical protein